jgi:hypothetical protein
VVDDYRTMGRGGDDGEKRRRQADLRQRGRCKTGMEGNREKIG